MPDHTHRFSDRVEDYVKFRPDYPREMTTLLKQKIGLRKDWIVADIGSGTGLSSMPFLEAGNTVYGVEPNADMRRAAETLLNHWPGFFSIGGTAEHTTLPDSGIDLIFCAQAFHWFDKMRARTEFDRILTPGGKIVLAWNQRDEADPFQQAYENLLTGMIEGYSDLCHRNVSDADIAAFLQPRPMERAVLDHRQIFDAAGLKGRLLSASYAPKSGPVYEQLMEGLDGIFAAFQQHNTIEFRYKTHLYWCG